MAVTKDFRCSTCKKEHSERVSMMISELPCTTEKCDGLLEVVFLKPQAVRWAGGHAPSICSKSKY